MVVLEVVLVAVEVAVADNPGLFHYTVVLGWCVAWGGVCCSRFGPDLSMSLNCSCRQASGGWLRPLLQSRTLKIPGVWPGSTEPASVAFLLQPSLP